MYCLILYLFTTFKVIAICFYFILDLFTASKDKSLQAVDMNTGGVAHAIKKAHKYVSFSFHVFSLTYNL